jgi:predicted amidohydrolase YtcJ
MKHVVFYNGQVVTVNEAFDIVQAISIRGDKIEKVGSNEEIKPSISSDTKIIDLKGKTVIPGFVDSHSHMLWTALERPKVSLANTASVADVLDIISDSCKKVGSGNWVETSQKGFEPKQLKENRSPTITELDLVSPDNPVIHEEHFHNSLVNSYVLDLFKISKGTPDPVGGMIFKNKETGEPTGWLGDNALHPVKESIPRPSREEKINLLHEEMLEFNKLGITSIIDPWINLDELSLYKDLLDKRGLTIRTKILMTGPPLAGTLSKDQIKMGPEGISKMVGLERSKQDLLRIDGMKSMLDTGVAGTYFRDPYEIIPGEQEDLEWRGWLSMSRDELKSICMDAADNGWRMGIHCAGDAAMDVMLDVWNEVNEQIPIVDKHWNLIHGQVPRKEHYPLIKKLGVHVACQSVHTYTMGADFVKWWGYDRAAYTDPIRTYLDNGIRVGGGSDAFFCEWEPVKQIWFDITRQSKWAGILGAEQAITREESLVYHTINAARMSDDDHKQGSLEPGKYADLVVLSDDVLTCPVDEIKEVKSLLTLTGGKSVYQDKRADIDNFEYD